MSDIAKRVAELSPEKRKLLLAQLNRKKGSTAQIRPLRRNTSVFPLSFAQQRLWFLDQLEPESIAYQVPSALSVQGPLESRALEQSLWQVIRRHEILRTTFEERDGQPVQVIHSAAEVTALQLPLIDLRGLSGSERQQVAHRLADQERQRPFDLARGPLLRAYLLWQAPQEHVLLLTLHHIITDGWSNTVFMRDVTTLYQALAEGRSDPGLSPLLIQYVDFATWQREWLQGEVLETQRAYWKQQLAEVPPLELPTDYLRPSVQSYQGAYQELVLAPELQQKLMALSQQADVTLFMLLLAAFQLLLARYSGQQDISVGTAMANRSRTELEGLIGFFVNTLVLRGDLSGDPRFSDLLIRVRQCALEAYAHQDVPFEQVVEMLQPERDLSRSPLFQVMFGVEQSTSEEVGEQRTGQIDGLTFTGLSQEHLTAKFDLSFTVTITASGLRCGLEYSTDLFAPQTIERLLLHWQLLLEGIVATPQARLSQLPLLTSQERRLLLSWNASQLDTPQEVCLHELVEAQVRRTPEAIALLSQQHSFTYESLNAHANQLAHFLHHLGAGPEGRIGLCLERGPELLIALLAILKTGAAYLPLDPNTPSERLAFILQDAQVPLLLTRSSLRRTLAEQAIQLLCLEEIRELVAHESRENLPRRASPDNLAYVIYTSGSTGQPKGTLIPHRGVVDHTLTIGADFGLQPGERVVQFASISFDVAVEEIFPTWASGATLLLRPEEIPTPGELLRWAQQQQVSVLNLPTAYWQNWVAELRQEAMSVPTSLRLVIVGGEAALTEQLAHWQAHTRETVRWINAYGPTETTITSTRYEAAPGSGERGPAMVSLGTPLPNRRAYVLNEHQELVPVGVAGELCLGGAGLARGYHQRADLTTERFVPDPFSGQPGARLYRTGDRVRYQADGTLHFLGRLDQQVKLRGYRIELGEIEQALERHAAVGKCVVLARQDVTPGTCLVAYVVGKGELAVPSAESLRHHLQEQLPEYMVPTFFVEMEALPLSSSGKVDRRALPAPQRQTAENGIRLPRTSVEVALAEIWCEVLGCSEVGIDDNFFALGGDSILSIRVITRARAKGLQLTPKQLFQYQTIAQLASVAQSKEESGVPQALASGEVPLTPIQHVFFAQDLPERHHYNQARLLEVNEELAPSQLYQAVWHLLYQHDALRLRFEQTATGWHQYHADPDPDVPMIFVDLSALTSAEQTEGMAAIATVAQASLNLSRGPLLRSLFFERGVTQAGRLLLIIHHLVVDAVSWSILLGDLEAALLQVKRGEVVHFPPRTTSFQQWTRGLHQYVQSDALQQELPYWLDIQNHQIAPLPLDMPGGSNVVADSQQIVVSLSDQETRTLLQEVPAAYHTQINDVLLTALVQAFAVWTGQQTLLVDLEGHGREELLSEVDLSRTVGWFTTIFPVMLNIERAATSGEALKIVKEQLRQIPQHGIGYGLLRYLSSDPATQGQLAHLPQAEVSFNYLGQFDSLYAEWSLLTPTRAFAGHAHSNLGQHDHLLLIDGGVANGQLHFVWQYSQQIHRHETIQRLTQYFLQALRELIAHCQSPEAGGYTPSDFPVATLDQPLLDRLVQDFQQVQGRPQTAQIEDIYPLSPMQSGLLFHHLYAPEAEVYHGQSGWTIQGSFDIEAWQRAWQQVVKRHAILRTCVAWDGLTQPLQIVRPSVELPWIFLDWQYLSEQEQHARLENLRLVERERGFELTKAPLLRLTLIRLGPDIYYFQQDIHHLLLDGWSQPLLLKEVLAYYETYKMGRELILPSPRPYRDYIAWLLQQDATRAEHFWRTYLAGFTEPTTLAIDRQSHVKRELAGNERAIEQRHLTEAVTLELQRFAQQQQLTMNTIVQGAWALLLARYCQDKEVVFGTTVAGRPPELAGIESMIGLFINTLPVRVKLEQEMPLVAWLAQLQTQQVEARQYEYTPLVEIQRWSEIPANLALFETLLVFQNYPLEPIIAQQKSALNVLASHGVEHSHYPLSLTATVSKGILGLQLSYDSSRFDAIMVTHILEYLLMILGNMASSSLRKLEDLPVLTHTERQLILHQWNDTRVDIPEDHCIHNLIEEQVEHTPDAIALVSAEIQLTYRELDQQANRLAQRLRALGVGPEVLVGLCVEPSLCMVVGVLGILKAGGAYVPLDSEYPTERLTFMMQDAQLAVLLTQRTLLERLPTPGMAVYLLDEQEAIQEEETKPAIQVSGAQADNLAYVIYTSGSTGQPKGVMITHRGLINYLYWARQIYASSQGQGALLHSPLSFDLTVTSLFVPLLTSQPVEVPGEKQGIEELAKKMRNQAHWSLLKMTPAHLEALNAMELGHELQGTTETLILGGEALWYQSLAYWQQLAPHCRLINEYGPTETVVGCSVYEVPKEMPEQGRVPIGRPIANTQLYILDARLQPVAFGQIGELYIGGHGVARAYLRRADLTATCFLPNPFSQEPGTRLYKTSDLARYMPDGNIEFLGRLDEQVKLRGYRIEPGEIEALLEQHPSVLQSVVVLREDRENQARLVAYLVEREESVGLSAGELRGYLQEKLPAYMVPQTFVTLHELPLTTNGKVDRAALPLPEAHEEETDSEWMEAYSPIEELLSEVWSQVLAHSPRGKHENFFEAGGHSLLATQLIARIRRLLKIEMPLRSLFDTPTIAGLARQVEQVLQEGQKESMPALLIRERPQDLPLSFAQQRLWFLAQLEPGNIAYLVSNALRLQGIVYCQALEMSLQAVIIRHEILRTTFEERDGKPVQVAHPLSYATTNLLPVIDLQALSQPERMHQADRLALQEQQQPIDLARGPLLRSWLLRLIPEEHVLLLTQHHIITDAWSSTILQRELGMLYRAFADGQSCSLAPLPIQYADYALWQRDWLQGEVLQAQLDYWKEQLAGLTPLELPADRARPSIQSGRGATRSLYLPQKLQQELITLSQREGITLFMLLLAAFQVLLARYSGQQDISVGTPIANRRHAEVEGLLGFFANTLVLRSNLAGNPSFREVLEQVRDVALSAYAHQDVPFEKLVEELQPERDISRSPLFQVMFILQRAVSAPEALQNLKSDAFHVENATAKFDLTLALFDTGQELHTNIEYNTDLFDDATIAQFLQHWRLLLEAIVRNPEQHINTFSLLSAVERDQILYVWNATQVAHATSVCLHDLFTKQANETPDAIAVLYEDEHLTYSELNRQANRLAHHLRTLGVGQNVAVGLCVERSLKMAIGILGILKAGGAYVPLDPAYPRDRLAFMLQQASVSVVVVQSHLSELFSEQKIRLVDIQNDWEAIKQESEEDLQIPSDEEQLLYIIFTSGSTGQPKGIAMPHRVLRNLIQWQQVHSTADVGSRTLQFSSLSFDVACQELFSTWCSGGCITLLKDEVRYDPARLLRLLDEFTIERLFLPFVALQQLAGAVVEQEKYPGHLKEVITAGEQLHITPAVRSFFAGLTDGALFNQYGPAESHVATAFKLEQQPSQWPVFPSIGKPIANTQIYILDHQGQLAPVGLIGELYIGGISLAHGYFNRPDLTAERFVPDTFTRETGGRLYRTGDQARYSADGSIQFLGRIDQQVKLRGYRIEPGEVEMVLGQHEAVKGCAVVVREDVPGNRQLVAYIIPNQKPEVVGELREYLKEKLPEYMVPSVFALLEALPLTPSGKVDRRALPVPASGTEDPTSMEIGPHSPIEELLSEIWSQVLTRPPHGINENFFEAGGHSLLAAQLIARVRKLVRVEVPLRSLFEAPTIAGLARRVEHALYVGQEETFSELVIRERPQELLLSFAQQRLWFLHQLEPESTAYLMPSVLRLQGALQCQALEQSLQELVRRHESLRTTFEEHNGQPVQVIQLAQTESYPFPVIDLLALSQPERIQQAELLAQQEQRPFDLRHGPLLRNCILRLGVEDHVLLLTLHHIITDGWSSRILQRELRQLYEAFVAGKPSPLTPLPIQYADYALWQRDWLQGKVLQAQLDYWKEQLAGLTPLELPTDHPRPFIQSGHGATRSLLLPQQLRQDLIALSQQEGVTLFMTLLAAFQVLLARYSSQQDISVGTPISNRRHAEVEELIGFFVNTLVLRCDLSGQPSFIELMERVRQVTLGAYAHQDVPFEVLVEHLAPQRDLSGSPLFQVMFSVVQQEQATSEDLGQLTQQEFKTEHSTTKFDMTFVVMSGARGLHCSVEYNADLFEASTIQRLLEHWQVLLHGIVEQPQQPIGFLPLLSASQEYQIQQEWNATRSAYPRDSCLHRLFETQVEYSPDAIALVFEEQQLTYRVLNAQANQLAHHLQQLGVGSEDLVGLCLERSPLLIISMLAILKAGGVYVPLDAAYPKERLAFMLADTQVALVLTQEHLRASLPQQEARLLCVDTEGSYLFEGVEHCDNLGYETHSKQLAYVMYTSGSTGLPKGVSISHQAVVRLVLGTNYIQLTASDIMAQAANTSFDAATFEIWGTLLSGGRLVGISKETLLAPHELADRLWEQEVTILFVTTALFNQVARMAPTAFGGLRHLLFGGEAVEVRWVREVLRAGAPQRLLHVYGPTESTTYASWYLVQQITPEEVTIPIGFPLANTYLYVLDEQYQLAPAGVKGELYIGGDGIARGYFNRAALTAERFVPDQWSDETGARLYRTGDLVRYREDGSIEYVGRVDRQVKIRGHRIELGEVETVLGAYPGMQESIVVAREEPNGEKRLVAYMVGQADQELSTHALRAYLQERLPAYMLPSTYVVLAAFPLTANGKVDRQALPAPEVVQDTSDHHLKAPRTPLEELLVELWSQVLGRSQVGIDENFFELGGHSLLATQLIARVRSICAIEVPLRAVFEAPTLSAFAQQVEQALRQDGEMPTPLLLAGERPEAIPLSFAQQRLWVVDQLEPGNIAYLVPDALRLQGPMHSQALELSLQEVIRRHEILRTSFGEQNGQPVQRIAPAVAYCLPRIDLRGLSSQERQQEVRHLIAQDEQHPFNLAHGPLLRACLLQLAPEEHVLLLTLHHIITDGWSNIILRRELRQLYEAFVAGKSSPLAPLPIQYADYALWQRNWLQGDTLQNLLDYWKRQLAGSTPLHLPTDHPRPEILSYRGAAHSFGLSPELSTSITTLSHQENVTLFMTILAAFQVLLYRYTGQADIVIGTDIANRTHAEAEALIGFFVNLLVLRNNLSNVPTFREVLSGVRQIVLEAYAHQDAPFEMLVEQLLPSSTFNRVPLVQVLFVLLNIPEGEEMPPEQVQVAFYDAQTTTAKFELALFLLEGPQGLRGTVVYNSELFEASSIARMVGRFETLLHSIVANPDTPIDVLDFYTEAEKNQQIQRQKKPIRKLASAQTHEIG